jgi:hypothetical protein
VLSAPGLRARRVGAATLVLAALLAAGAVAALAGGAGRVAAHSRLCPQLFGSFSVGHWPPACWRPYGSRSPFNVRIPANPRLAPDAAAIEAYMTSHRWSFDHDDSGRLTFDGGGTRPVYWSSAGDPVVTVSCPADHACGGGLHVHLPTGALPQNEGDGHMTVVDQAQRREYDFYQATTLRNGAMHATAGRSIPIGPNSGTGIGADAEAAYLGLLGGLIRAPELAAGRIEHALAITTPCVQPRDVWPSPSNGRGDTVCPGGGAGPHFASLLQLDMSDAQIAATHAPRWQRTIMTAMAHYGMYVVDTGGAGGSEMSLEMEDDASFESFGYPGAMARFVRSVGGSGKLVGVPIDFSKLRVIASCVPRRTC